MHYVLRRSNQVSVFWNDVFRFHCILAECIYFRSNPRCKCNIALYSSIVKSKDDRDTLASRLAIDFAYGATLNIETLPVAPGVNIIPVKLSDASALASLVADNIGHLQTFMPKVVALDTLPAAQKYLQAVVETCEAGNLLEWHIYAGERLCGAVRINHIERENRKASVGYYLGEKHLGNGLATGSVRAVLQFVFQRLGFNRIELKCASNNVASQRVAERLGFSWEGLLRQAELVNGVYNDQFVYGLLRADFEARQAEQLQQAA